ncbi:MBL fold metallo-hydrolase [Mycobacterium sp. 852002-51057_SCH5723018]|uniref:MBL fold metallo-hydrolase n=1 Tax=Mycobacterium sp. 852002-51057_SCH5723018 TaxID=1834094 RepID=UPI0007FCAA0D|nr:MBL fold metallo-hydrolase [Mycobacterium sp. 852002-51057_SCH5723018]OBG25287.1 Zn-dependent hydrolase [Mycobacterium sp. 852002-51057_SCH5723018]
MDANRQRVGISVLGGPTTVVDLAGWRFIVDPTFDDPGEHGHLIKTAGPAISPSALGFVDAVLISHDEHLDNLDAKGRAFALEAPRILTNPGAAERLGPPAQGLTQWESINLATEGDRPVVTVQAVPAVHGPADGDRDGSGHVTCETTGFVLTGDSLPTIYLSGDNASLEAVADIAHRSGPIDLAVLFVGAARVPSRQNGRLLTLSSTRAAAAAEVLRAKVVIPAHTDGWAHFSEGVDDIQRAFSDAGISNLLRLAPVGEWIVPTVAL